MDDDGAPPAAAEKLRTWLNGRGAVVDELTQLLGTDAWASKFWRRFGPHAHEMAEWQALMRDRSTGEARVPAELYQDLVAQVIADMHDTCVEEQRTHVHPNSWLGFFRSAVQGYVATQSFDPQVTGHDPYGEQSFDWDAWEQKMRSQGLGQ